MKISVIAPFHNEEGVVKKVVLEILSALRPFRDFEFICVQDGSGDSTGIILKNLLAGNPELRVVEILQSFGYGHAVRKGLEATSGEIVGYIDGDGQIDLEDIIRVLRCASSVRAAKAKRVKRRDGWKRAIISRIYNLLTFLLFGFLSSDVNAKPKFFKREDLEKMKLVSNDWFIDAEIMIKAKKLGIKWRELPIEFKKREEGFSKVSWRTNLEWLKNLFIWRFGKKLSLWQKQTIPKQP